MRSAAAYPHAPSAALTGASPVHAATVTSATPAARVKGDRTSLL